MSSSSTAAAVVSVAAGQIEFRGGGMRDSAGGATPDSGPRSEPSESAAAGAGATRDEFDDDIPF